MKKAEKVALIIKALENEYSKAECSLVYDKPYELIIAGRLSAQCTDARVNIVTKDLFQRFDSLEAFSQADESEVQAIIKSCGLYKTKAKSIVEMSKQLLYNYNGQIPDSIDELTKLSGVGRKTANLIMGDIFHKPAVVADTHCIRISGRLGLTKSKDPLNVEKELVKIIPPEKSSDFCHRIVQFGRDYCKARMPLCDLCPIKKVFEDSGDKLSCTLK
ncbi:MAG TPA: endonuclease III [Oscillospiraceae bacterium]|nr:endonuclease III [Oscillospiraceae bacterium]